MMLMLVSKYCNFLLVYKGMLQLSVEQGQATDPLVNFTQIVEVQFFGAHA